MVKDKATREDYPGSIGLGTRIDAHARRNGLILRIVGNRIAFSPPLIITHDELVALSVRVRRTLDDTYRDIQSL